MRFFHIDLSHVQDRTGIQFKFGRHVSELKKHDAASIVAARETNHALAALPLDTCYRFTHFVEIPEELLPTEFNQWIRIIRPQENPEIFVPNLFLMELYIPESFRRSYFEKKLKKNATYRHPLLAFYGLAVAASCEHPLEACLDASHLVTAFSTASGLLFHHPNLASIQPYTATRVIRPLQK